MSRFERHIVDVFGKSKRLLSKLLLSMFIFFALMPTLSALAQADSWRRTANGWERVESWNYLVTAPVGKLRPLTLKTLMQRSWPATIAAAEVCFVLVIMHFGSGSTKCKSEEPSPEEITGKKMGGEK